MARQGKIRHYVLFQRNLYKNKFLKYTLQLLGKYIYIYDVKIINWEYYENVYGPKVAEAFELTTGNAYTIFEFINHYRIKVKVKFYNYI